ncbi:PhzF family phenazine biosynthesis protein [Aurantivibrio plasticivorans]
MHIPFYTADVFTNATFGGAQVAVVTESDQLSDQQMQQIAQELNLWSTVFLNHEDSQNTYSLRMFTPEKEIDFGSHATLAAAQVLASTGKANVSDTSSPIILRHKTGDIDVHVTRQQDNYLATFSLTTQPVVDNYVPSNEELASLLSIDSKMIGIKDFKPLLVANKGVYIVVPIYYREQLEAAVFDRAAWNHSLAPNTLAQQIILFSPQTEQTGADFHLRLLSPTGYSATPPPIGSAIPAFSAYLCAHDHIQKGTYSFIAERGSSNTRQSLLHVEVDNKGSDQLTIRIGGTGVVVCEGNMRLS